MSEIALKVMLLETLLTVCDLCGGGDSCCQSLRLSPPVPEALPLTSGQCRCRRWCSGRGCTKRRCGWTASRGRRWCRVQQLEREMPSPNGRPRTRCPGCCCGHRSHGRCCVGARCHHGRHRCRSRCRSLYHCCCRCHHGLDHGHCHQAVSSAESIIIAETAPPWETS